MEIHCTMMYHHYSSWQLPCDFWGMVCDVSPLESKQHMPCMCYDQAWFCTSPKSIEECGTKRSQWLYLPGHKARGKEHLAWHMVFMFLAFTHVSGACWVAVANLKCRLISRSIICHPRCLNQLEFLWSHADQVLQHAFVEPGRIPMGSSWCYPCSQGWLATMGWAGHDCSGEAVFSLDGFCGMGQTTKNSVLWRYSVKFFTWYFKLAFWFSIYAITSW